LKINKLNKIINIFVVHIDIHISIKRQTQISKLRIVTCSLLLIT